MPKEKPIKDANDLGDFLDDWGKELGMPAEDDEDAYKSDCPACGWTGDIMAVVFRDGDFYCPACDHKFQPRHD